MKAQSTAKSTVAQRELEVLRAGLDVFQRTIESRCPPRFQWAFLVDSSDLVVTWFHEGGTHYAREIRARCVSELLSRWARIDWAAEEAAAIAFRGYVAGA